MIFQYALQYHIDDWRRTAEYFGRQGKFDRESFDTPLLIIALQSQPILVAEAFEVYEKLVKAAIANTYNIIGESRWAYLDQLVPKGI